MISAQEKKYIVEQRALGKSFSEIASVIDKKENAVRMAYLRIVGNTSPVDEEVEGKRCRRCGKSIEGMPHSGVRQFCSIVCHDKWWNEHKKNVPYKLRCESCGKAFTAYGNPKKRFCSPDCYAASRINISAENGRVEMLDG